MLGYASMQTLAVGWHLCIFPSAFSFVPIGYDTQSIQLQRHEKKMKSYNCIAQIQAHTKKLKSLMYHSFLRNTNTNNGEINKLII